MGQHACGIPASLGRHKRTSFGHQQGTQVLSFCCEWRRCPVCELLQFLRRSRRLRAWHSGAGEGHFCPLQSQKCRSKTSVDVWPRGWYLSLCLVVTDVRLALRREKLLAAMSYECNECVPHSFSQT